MIRVQANVVLKYFEPVDEFLRVRVFTPEEAGRLMAEARITDKRSYVGLVLNACLVRYNEEVLTRLRAREPAEPQFGVEEKLFALCCEVNPAFDLRRVSIPAPEGEASPLCLLENRKGAPARDYRHLRELEAALADAVVGQAEAVAGVARAVRKAMTGLRDPERPLGAFFFVGQTGVGKTELAKALTRHLFAGLDAMLRVDCSEYALPHEYAKLIGAPPGYIGHDEGGVFAAAARRGVRVLLFDEIEKSDPQLHHLLLQLMDEGFVTDNKGRRVEFRDAILILTSNVGADEIAAARGRMGFDAGRRHPDRSALREETADALRRHFRPEFLNRVSEVVLFNSLDLPQCEEIARRCLDEVRRHAAGVPLTLRFEPAVPHRLAELSYRPEYGAREVRRTVEREVEGPLSEMLVDERLHEGDQVTIGLRGGRLDFRRN